MAWLGRRPLVLVALALLYFVVARASLGLAFEASNASPIWPPSGLALAALLLGGGRCAVAVWLGAFGANLLGFLDNAAPMGPSLLASTLIACGNTAEAWVGSALLRRAMGDGLNLRTPQQVYAFAGVALGAALLSAGVGVASLTGLGLAPLAAAGTITWTWWLGDVTGMLVVTPVVLALVDAWRHPPAFPIRRVVGPMALGLVALFLCFGGVLAEGHWDRVATFGLVVAIVASSRLLGPLGAALATLCVTVPAVLLTLGGHGPFAKATVNDSLISLDVFLALCALTGLVTSLSAGRPVREQGRLFRVDQLPLGLLLGALGLTVIVWHAVSLESERRAQERFHALHAEVLDRLQARVASDEHALRAARGLFAASEEVSREDWRSFVASLDFHERHKSLLGLGYAEAVSASARDAHVARQAAQGLPGYRIVPLGERAFHAVVTFLEPATASNQRALGFDLFHEAVRRAALERSRDSGELVASGLLTLVQDQQPGVAMSALDQSNLRAGFLWALPLYRAEAPAGTPSERRSALRGWITAPVRVRQLMETALQRTDRSLMDVALFDGVTPDPAAVMFRSTAVPSSYDDQLVVAQSLMVGGRPWTLQLRSTPAFEAQVDTQKAQIMLLAGALVSLLLYGLGQVLTHTRQQALTLAETMGVARAVAERRFVALAETARDAILVLDGEDRVVFANPATATLLGRAEPALLGLTVNQVLAMPARLSDWPMNDQQGAVVETQGLRPDGSSVPVELAVGGWSVQGETHHGLILRDVTLRHRASAELRAAVNAAVQANAAKTQFLANMSHEIRTPMNAVIGLSYLLARTPLDADQQGLIDRIQRAGVSLLALLNDILDLSKIEAGALQLEWRTFAVADLLRDLEQVMGLQAQAKGLQLDIEPSPTLPEALVGDAHRLKQMLGNLLANAIKFTRVGRVTLQIESIAQEGPTPWWRFSVSDTGIGIAAEAQLRLFQPFSQADSGTTRQFGGTGLGLSIVKRLAELMQGRVGVASEAGKGSCFWIELPMDVAEAAPPPRLNVQATSLQGLHLLVVDDSEINREVARRILVLAGATVDEAGDGRAALDRLRQTTSTPFDAVLMDIQMPVMDGCEATRTLRRNPAWQSLPVIALSAGAMAEDRAIAQAAGMNDFVGKPFDPAELISTIAQHVRPVLPQGGDASASSLATEAPSMASAWPSLDGIDSVQASRQVAGDLALFTVLMGRMVRELDALRGLDPDGLSMTAWAAQFHRMRGQLSTVGALPLAALSAELESRCRSGDAQALHAHWPDWVGQAERLRDAAAAWLATRQTTVPPGSVASNLEATDLVELIRLLNKNDLEALKIWDRLKPALGSKLGAVLLTELQQAMDDLDFAAVAVRLAAVAV